MRRSGGRASTRLIAGGPWSAAGRGRGRGERAERAVRPRARRPRAGECENERGVPQQPAASRRAARDVRIVAAASAAREFLRTGGFPGVVTGTRNRSFGDALGQAFTPDYPTWSFGVTVSYPLGRSYEEASLARADIERRQVEQRIASLRLQAAETIRQAARQIQSGAERVDAAQRWRHARRAALRVRSSGASRSDCRRRSS